MKGIEPSYAAWEAAVLPLNYTRVRVVYRGHGPGKVPTGVPRVASGASAGYATCDNRGMQTIVVNGETRPLPAPGTVAALLAELGMTGRRIAVERNGEIVPRSRHETEALVPGDRLEIVVAVGGG